MVGLHGMLLIATGVIHILFGLSPAIYLSDWNKFLRHGFWNQITIDDDRRMAAFWFLIAGPLFIVLGMSIHEFETHGIPLSQSIGFGLLAIGVIGAVLSPKSGFTIFILPQALFYLYSASH